MPTIDIEKTQQAWTNLKQILFIPPSESEYEQLVIMLDNLIDEIGENENHPLASLAVPTGWTVIVPADRGL